MTPTASSSGPPARGDDGFAVVVRVLANGMYRLRIADGLELDAHVASDLRMAVARLLPGDRVRISRSPFDQGKARIIGFPRLEQSQNEPTSHPTPKRELS